MSTSSSTRYTRRTLIKQGAGGLVAAPWLLSAAAGAATTSLPASERITVGFIGIGRQGYSHLERFVGHKDAQVVAVCDVDKRRLNKAKAFVEDSYAAERKSGQFRGCEAYGDFRQLLARPDIDAVFVSTGDRWHPMICVLAAKAGKDIFCEKPLSVTIEEARVMADTANRYGRVFQTGLQQRSTREFRIAVELIHSGRLGALKIIYANRVGTNGLTNLPAEPVPDTLDWDMWVGPAAFHPFNHKFHFVGEPETVTPWRFCRDYSGGDMTNSSVHTLDIAQWALGMDRSGPVEVAPPENGDTNLLTYKYANGVIVQSIPHQLDPKTQYIPEGFDPKTRFQWDLLFVGERGWIYAGRKGVLYSHPKELLTDIPGANNTERGNFSDMDFPGRVHHRNWLHSIRTRQQPVCDAETGARSTIVAHMGSIAFWTGRKLQWDPIKEEFIGDAEANRMRSRTMREPWKF